jgi:hypothetical protein
MVWNNFIHPIMAYFRIRRLKSFVKAYPDPSRLSVLDVSGRPYI